MATVQMNYQQPQQLRAVRLSVIAPENTDNERWNMARKLAMICHYLNTRCRTGVHFLNLGVTEKHFVDPDSGEFDNDDDGIYLRVDNELIEHTKENSLGLLNNNMDDEEIRNCAHRYVSNIRERVQGMSFLNIMQ